MRRRRVWLAFALLLAMAVLPIYSTRLPPLFDAANHLARMHLLAEGGNRFYAVHWAPLPNLAEDLIVPALGRLMPLDQAARLFIVAILGLTAGGAVWLNRVVTGGWRLWPLLGFMLLYNRIFLWGFLNYLFGVGLAICGVALWLGLEDRKRLRVAVSVVVALACYLSHIAAFGFYALVILGVEAASGWDELRARRWTDLVRRLLWAVPQAVVPAALILGSWSPAASGRIGYGNLWRKADLLFSVFDNYNRAFDALCFALFVGGLGVLAWRGRLGLDRRLGWAASLVFLAYLALPSQMLTGSGADHRLPAALFLLVVASSSPRWPSRRTALTVGALASVVLVTRFAVIERIWRLSDRVYAADLAGLDALPAGALIAVAFPDSAIHVVRVPEIHLATLAASRGAFVPTLFAYPAQQPIRLEPAYAALAALAQPHDLWAGFVVGNAVQRSRLWPTLRQFDYIVFVDRGPVHVRPTPCLSPVFATASFQILKVAQGEVACGD